MNTENATKKKKKITYMLSARHLYAHFICAQLMLRSHCSGITNPLLSYDVGTKRAVCRDLQYSHLQ